VVFGLGPIAMLVFNTFALALATCFGPSGPGQGSAGARGGGRARARGGGQGKGEGRGAGQGALGEGGAGRGPGIWLLPSFLQSLRPADPARLGGAGR